MVLHRKPIAVEEAVRQVMEQAVPLGTTEKELVDCDEHDVLAEPVIADHDVPPFDRSPYDGFAIRAVDTKKASREHPVTLNVIEAIGAGEVAKHAVNEGTAIRIMTGAALPEGADAIVKLELARENGDTIEINRPFFSGDNISWKGEDTKAGTPLIEAGSQITAGVSAVLATFGYARIRVFRRPRVGVIATGSELLDITEPLVPGKIRNSNAYMVLAQIKKTGAIPIHIGQCPDDFDASYKVMKDSLERVDLLMTTGGVSVGDFDFLPAIYEKLGAKVLFNKVAMRPGSVTTVARLNNQLLFGLSGNPSACFVGFELFAAPYIRALMGNRTPYLSKMKAVLTHDFPKANPYARFVRSQITLDADRQWSTVTPVGLDKSGVVTSLARANALTVLPGRTSGFTKGDIVETLLLNGERSAVFTLENLSNRRL
ncbi:gephyrin-like molybdotransferase Glp [Camelliibacillus cellulosilyticus]|uniref:Molybdopterin molybdenumtransferase n=1 Tax=Camelliibacillus cellulosilyticus TaxID=2174486 RepID=A0ABV9GQ11_9BACL